MNKRLLGNTGIEVSEVAFGGVEIGMPYGIGVAHAEDMIQEADAIKLLNTAVDKGINFFDTAHLYGKSEEIMGKAFKGRRHEVIIGTKCTEFTNPDGSIPARAELKKIIHASLDQSLKALQTDHVDIFMLHRSSREILENEDVAELFSGLKRSGVVRSTGVSTYVAEDTERAIKAGVWDVIQLPFNLLNQKHYGQFALAAKKGIAIVVRSVLLKGLLSDRGKNLHPALKEVEDHIQSYSELLSATYPDLPTLATKFALSFKEVAAVLVGIDKLEYLDKALHATDGHYLDSKTKERALALRYPDPDFLDLSVWDRKGWLK